MSWNLLSFTLPVLSFLKASISTQPKVYDGIDALEESPFAERVRRVAKRALEKENNPGGEHYERIQEMLKELPSSEESKDIDALLRHRLKVKQIEGQGPASTTGTDSRAYYILMGREFMEEKFIAFTATHELGHILREDGLNSGLVKGIGSLGTATLATFGLGWSLWASLGAVILGNFVAHTVHAQLTERWADDFAIKHCSEDELQGGVELFESIKQKRADGIYKKNFLAALLHPSEDLRIEKILRHLKKDS